MAKRKARSGSCRVVRTKNGTRRLKMTPKGPRFVKHC